MSRDKNKACKNCEYFNPAKNDEGVCHRWPESLYVGSKHWCGEHLEDKCKEQTF